MSIDDEINEEKPEEELDLVELMQKVESDFRHGVENSTLYKTPGEQLRDYQEFN